MQQEFLGYHSEWNLGSPGGWDYQRMSQEVGKRGWREIGEKVDIPIELDFVETDDSFGPFGSKGVGEPGLVPTAPAIANAIYDAIGVRIHDLPITPEKILAALKKD